MRTTILATGMGLALLGFIAVASADPVPLPRPAPVPKTDAATEGDNVPRPPASVPERAATTGSTAKPAPAPAARAAVPPGQKAEPVQTVQAVAPPAPAAPPEKSAKPAPAAIIGPNGVAFDAKQQAILQRVNAYLTSLQNVVGDFVQVGPDGTRSEGKFYMQKPGRVRFEYDPPSPVELIADGQSLAVRDRKLATQDLYFLSQTPLRFLLADRIDLLNDSNLTAVYADDLFVTLVIEEQHVIGGTHRLMLMFGAKDFRLRQWTITDPQGYDTTVALYNLDTSKRPDPSLFTIDYQRMLQ